VAEGDGREVTWLDEFVAAIRDVHDQIIRQSGGAAGEHTELLYSACARPFQSAFGEPIYPTPVGRAAALFHAIICDHAFVDGNKRTATVTAILILSSEGYLQLDPPSHLQVTLLGEVALETASGGLAVEQVGHWLERIFAP
jgi:death-on-curing protein